MDTFLYFYPRPPRGGRPSRARSREPPQKISIHALREEGDPIAASLDTVLQISIHALREEGDPTCSTTPTGTTRFLSTPSARRATRLRRFRVGLYPISIHALREEGDLAAFRLPAPTSYFYPRPPRGGRPRLRTRASLSWYFYPRPPRGGRQWHQYGASVHQSISIHALREEGDLKCPGGVT